MAPGGRTVRGLPAARESVRNSVCTECNRQSIGVESHLVAETSWTMAESDAASVGSSASAVFASVLPSHTRRNGALFSRPPPRQITRLYKRSPGYRVRTVVVRVRSRPAAARRPTPLVASCKPRGYTRSVCISVWIHLFLVTRGR